MADEYDKDEMAQAIARFRPSEGISMAPAARRQRQRRQRSAVDGRSLYDTGRTVQFNFRSREDVKEKARDLAIRRGITIAEMMEKLIEEAWKSDA